MSQPEKENSETKKKLDSQHRQHTSRNNNGIKKLKDILMDKLQRNKSEAALIIIVIGLAGIVVLNQLDTSQSNPNVSSEQVDLVTTGKGNFKQDLNGTTLFIGHKVVFVYVGGQFCPYCAMERWAIDMALSQFGTFSKPSYFYSSEDHIATYNFTNMTYSSSKVDFESVENAGQNRELLQPLTGLPLTLYNRYDTQDYIPFIVIGGLYVQIGPGPSLNTINFSGLTYQQITAQIQASKGTVYNEILAESTIMVGFINQLFSQQSNTNTTT